MYNYLFTRGNTFSVVSRDYMEIPFACI